MSFGDGNRIPDSAGPCPVCGGELDSCGCDPCEVGDCDHKTHCDTCGAGLPDYTESGMCGFCDWLYPILHPPLMLPERAGIITRLIFPPLSSRWFDWSATLDGYEPGQPIGMGPTERYAIEDLLEQLEDSEGLPVVPDPQDEPSTCSRCRYVHSYNEGCSDE